MNKLLTGFVKITGLPVQYFYFHKKIYYEDKKHTSRKIKGGALIVSNHTSVYDYPLIMFTFFKRSIHTLVAEVIYEKGAFLRHLITGLGAIKVNRNNYDFAFMDKMMDVLNNNKVGLVFPESRIPQENEKDDLLEFKPSYVYLALKSGVPIIPVYTNGVYGKLKKKKKDRGRKRTESGRKEHVANLFQKTCKVQAKSA